MLETLVKQYSGDVVKRPHAVGTKSEHNAVLLETGGCTYKIVRKGGNPFSDPELDKYVGKKIKCDGIFLRSGQLTVSNIEVIEE